MHIDLSEKRVIVTGASRGIGRAIARGFANEKARVAVCARDEVKIRESGDELERLTPNVIARSVDVGDTAQAKRFVDEVATEWGGVDVLINNAGQGRSGNIDNLAPEAILEHANILQVAHFRMAQAVVPHMRKQHWGRIIDINAVVGHNPVPTGIPSATNRAACIAMSRSLAMMLGPDNILVNSLNMGWINTGQWDRHHAEVGPGISREEFIERTLKVVPLGRFGEPEDVVGIALFLASDHASFITGASIDVTGGMAGQIAYYPTIMQEMVELGRERVAKGEA